jgi:hypothetical protein
MQDECTCSLWNWQSTKTCNLLVALYLAGAAYITYKGIMFVLRSLSANFPHVRELASLLQPAVQAVQAVL